MIRILMFDVKVFRCVLGVLAALVFCIFAQLPVFATTETEEEAEASKLHDFVSQSFWIPAIEAANKGELERALALRKRAVDEWSQHDYKYQWAQNNQWAQICDNMRGEADVLRKMGRYEDAAKVMMQVDEKVQARQQPAERSRADAMERSRGDALEAARTYVEGKMNGKAKKILDEIIASGNPSDKIAAHVQLSRIYKSDGNNENAVSELTNLLSDAQFTQTPYLMRRIRTSLKELYQSIGDKANADRIEELLQSKICPKCGSDRSVVRIGYGLPSFPVSKDVHLGGCVVSPDSPRWWCETDKLAF